MTSFNYLAFEMYTVKTKLLNFFPYQAYRGGIDNEDKVKSASGQVIQTTTAYSALLCCVKWWSVFLFCLDGIPRYIPDIVV